MHKLLSLTALLARLSLQRQTQYLQIDSSTDELNLTFGSCYGLFNAESNIFENIVGADVFVWLGDAAYFGAIAEVPVISPFYEAPEKEIVRQYAHTKMNPSYQKLLASRTKVIGVWDDHDYGTNNGDRTMPGKQRNRKYYLDFIDEPKDSERYLDTDSPLH